MSRFRSKLGVYLFGKVRRTDWLPVRETAKSMEQDQVDRSEESMSDYDSEDEDANVMPRDYEGDDHSISGESTDPSEPEDAAAMDADYAADEAIFAGWRANHQKSDYVAITPIIPW